MFFSIAFFPDKTRVERNGATITRKGSCACFLGGISDIFRKDGKPFFVVLDGYMVLQLPRRFHFAQALVLYTSRSRCYCRSVAVSRELCPS